VTSGLEKYLTVAHEAVTSQTGSRERAGMMRSRVSRVRRTRSRWATPSGSVQCAGKAASKESVTSMTPGELTFEGTWLSRYALRRSGQSTDQAYEHYVVMREQGNRLRATSLPHSSGSTLSLDLTIEPPTATGTWRESTSPDGPYDGATYHGALQLIIAPDGRTMSGLWVGFGRHLNMKTGEWTLTLNEGSTDLDAR